MRTTNITRALLASGLLVIAACSKSNDRMPENANTTEARVDETSPRGDVVNPGTGTSAGRQTASATDAITDSRCAREAHCDNIGANKKYSSMDDCRTRIRTDWKEDLNARECPSGVDQKQLDECLVKVRSEDCGSPFDTLGRIAACTASQICAG